MYRTDFNNNVHKQSNRQWNYRMQKAWDQTQKQLIGSPGPKIIAERIEKIIRANSPGVYHEGSFSHRLYSLLDKFSSFKLKKFFLLRRYFS